MANQKLKDAGIKTDSQIKQAIKEHDGGDEVYAIQGYKGLNLYIRDNKTTTFRHRFTSPVTGKRKNFTLGAYPVFTLEQARDMYRNNLSLLAGGIDPVFHHQDAHNKKRAMPTFSELAEEWLQSQIASKQFEHRTIEQKRTHIAYAATYIGRMPVDQIRTPDVLRAIKEIERKTIPTAKRVRGVCQRIFALAIGQGYIDNNPAIAVADLMLPKPKTEHHHAIIEPVAFGQLLRDIDSVTDFYGHAQNILRLQAMLFQRSGDMCSMKWDAIDMDAQTWTFSPQKTGNRGDMVASLIVPLPAQAIELLQAIHEQTGHTDYVFYNKRRKDRFEHQQQLNKFLNRLGYTGKHTPHGFRASARTLMVEQLGVPEVLIEHQLGHSVRDANGRAYNRVTMIDKRRDMMQKWADYLDSLIAANSP
ncbi:MULTISPECIES: tyrosine-type recombinase/integrase [unclassified Psychrobacter]|uniref:tyrosine-type recombinase/integrase n=1 Tax=unclassified Psychrobacter TaxID=196806 RepID=UPI0026014B00|nr:MULTISPECIES: site-specific integrase [unclassified Psychrobacter]